MELLAGPAPYLLPDRNRRWLAAAGYAAIFPDGIKISLRLDAPVRISGLHQHAYPALGLVFSSPHALRVAHEADGARQLKPTRPKEADLLDRQKTKPPDSGGL